MLASKGDRHLTKAEGSRGISSTPERVSRIHKADDNHHRHRRRVSSDLLGRFQDELDRKAEQIGTWAEEKLAAEETRLKEELKSAEDHFASRLKSMKELEGLVDAPFGNQTPGTFKQQYEETGEWDEVVIDDRIRDYIMVVQQEEEKLEELSNQWENSQVELVSLALEVLGFSNAQLEEDEELETVVKLMNKAGIKHQENEKRYVEAGNSITRFKADLLALHKNTTKLTKAQQKSWRAEKKRKLDEINKVLRGF